MWVAAVTQEQHDALWGDDEYGQQSRTLLWAEGIDHSDVCTLQEVSTWASLPPSFSDVEEAVVFEIEQLMSSRDGPSVTGGDILDLPAGPVGRYTAVDADGSVVARYFYRTVEAWYKLECHGPEPPPDRWLSIGESFEFLTAEDLTAPASSR